MVVAIVAIAFGVNNASSPLPAVVSPTPTAVVPTPSATPSPTAAPTIPFADCSTATFGPVLAPLNPPASVHTYAAAPAMTIDTSKLYQATIVTAKGDIVLCLQPDLAPNTVNVFVTLARNHFYDGIPFHRVVAGFVVQGGDPDVHRRSAGRAGDAIGDVRQWRPGIPVQRRARASVVCRRVCRDGEQRCRHQYQRIAVLHLHRRTTRLSCSRRTTCSARSSPGWTSS